MSDRGAPHFAGLLALILVVWITFYWLTPRQEQEPGLTIDRGGDGAGLVTDRSADPVREDVTSEDDTRGARLPDPPPIDTMIPEDVHVEGDAGGHAIEPPVFRIHTVAPGGETLQEISKRYYGSFNYWRAIARANGHSVDPNRLLPGTEVKVPLDPKNVQGLPLDDEDETDGGSEPEEETQYTEYIVSRNDSLWTISKALYGSGAKWRVIRDANRDLVGNDGEKLRPGMVLRIPPPPGN